MSRSHADVPKTVQERVVAVERSTRKLIGVINTWFSDFVDEWTKRTQADRGPIKNSNQDVRPQYLNLIQRLGTLRDLCNMDPVTNIGSLEQELAGLEQEFEKLQKSFFLPKRTDLDEPKPRRDRRPDLKDLADGAKLFQVMDDDG